MGIFNVKTKIFFGEHALERVKELGITKACIICDPFVVSSGMIDRLTSVLDEAGITYKIFSDIVPDPPIEVVTAGLRSILDHNPDAVIAFGGGSAIDSAKAVSYFYTKITDEKKPLCITIPTTSGTGSEVTSFAVISDNEKHVKCPIIDDSLMPNIAILEPELIRSVPPTITADTGMDVLTHALEAYVAINTNDFDAALAEKAIRFVFKYLPKAYEDPDHMRAREKVHNASCMAGIAFNHAGLGINHGMAHAMGSILHISHGRSNAILLPYIVEFNAELNHSATPTKTASRYAFIAELMNFPASNPAQGVRSLVREIRHLSKKLGIPSCLKEFGIEEQVFKDNLDYMCELALKDRCVLTNPRTVSIKQVRELYLSAYNNR